MADRILNDRATRAAQFALDGLAKRQEAIGRNLANVDTPGYHAQNVNFEETLQAALRQEDRPTLQLARTSAGHLGGAAEKPLLLLSYRQGGSQRADGNNVNIDTELTQMAETGLRYQALTQLISKKLLLLKSIATGR
jgi:flagellar basal-body rod protein FlgB